MKISDIIALGLWPESKKITSEKGLESLENLGYNLFYIGKNADLYTCPGDGQNVLLVRSDRCSVFDIPLNLEIEGKGKYQSMISQIGADFAKKNGFKTAYKDLPDDIPVYLLQRCQMMELCKALEAEIEGKIVQFEFIFRNYLTGSLFEATKDGKDPYGLGLDKSYVEWHKFNTPLFTPTTKGLKDEPLNSISVRNTLTGIVESLENLFQDFTNFALDNSIVIVDTKFEVFVNSQGEFVLGDEILTPESSRFISKDDFDKGNYISMDKQILREYGKKENWKELAKSLNPSEKLDVSVPEELKNKIMDAYKKIYKALSS